MKTSDASAKARAVRELRPEIPLKTLLAAAHLARSTYYDECKRMDQSDKYAPVKVEIQKVFQSTVAGTVTEESPPSCETEGSSAITKWSPD